MGFILLHPGVQFKSVEGDALFADRDLCEVGPDFSIEAISVHAEIEWRISKPDQSWSNGRERFLGRGHLHFPDEGLTGMSSF